MAQQIELAGVSGSIYRYSELEPGRVLLPAGANYVIVYAATTGVEVLFAGETENLAEESWRGILSAIQKQFPSARVMTRLNVSGATRRAEQEDLISAYAPVLNRAQSAA